MTDPKARPPTDSEERVRELEKALRLIAADGYGLQGLVEEGASDTEIAEYWKSELDRRRSMARAALGEARETASASESLKPCPHGFRYRPECPECSLDIEPLNSEQGALRASIDDLLAKAKKAFQRKQDILRAAKASALNTEAEKYRAGVALCEWTDAAELLECIVPAGAPPAPDLLRENARLREGPGAAHAASPSVCEVEAANPWRDALIELLDLKNLISEAPDNIIIDRCPASGRGEAHGEHEAGEWVAWDSDYPDEGAISLKGLIAPAHIAVVDTPSDRSGTAPQAPSALEEELTRARAAHLENATLLAKANARVAAVECTTATIEQRAKDCAAEAALAGKGDYEGHLRSRAEGYRRAAVLLRDALAVPGTPSDTPAFRPLGRCGTWRHGAVEDLPHPQRATCHGWTEIPAGGREQGR